MKTKLLAAVLALGTSVAAANVTFAAEKEAAKSEAKPAAAGVDEKAKSAEKAADAKPADAAPAPSAAGVKLVKPWSDIASLSDEQKLKIEALHKKALAEINAIEKKEKDDITAVLTDAQRAELKDSADKKKKEAAAKRAAEKKAAR